VTSSKPDVIAPISLIALAVLVGCAVDDARPPMATVLLKAGLPGAESACFEVGFAHGPDDASVELRTHCAPVVAGLLELRVTTPCDRRAPAPRAVVRLSDAIAVGHLLDPCAPHGCSSALDCDGPAAELRLAFADDATDVDWVDTQIAMPDLWLGATLATCQDATPIALLVDEPDGPKRATAIVGLSAAAQSETLELALAEPLITCGDDIRCALHLDEERGRAIATCSDGSTVDYQVFSGAESIDDAWSRRYLNIAIDLQDLIDAGHADCRLDHASTASLGPLARGPGDAWPVASYHAPLLDAEGSVTCVAVSFDDYGKEDPSLLSIDFLRGPGLSPAAGLWSEVPSLCVSVAHGILTNTCR